MDGSISAEHGIGRAKVRWLALSRTDAELATMRALKSALDPDGLLNPGVLLLDDGLIALARYGCRPFPPPTLGRCAHLRRERYGLVACNPGSNPGRGGPATPARRLSPASGPGALAPARTCDGYHVLGARWVARSSVSVVHRDHDKVPG